nr:MFS transporter [Bradyrhizobium hipponense]
MPVLAHERGLPASVIGTILGAALLLGIYPFRPGAGAMASCSVLLGIAMGTVQPMVMSTMHRLVPEHRHGHAIAMRLIAVNLSSVTMPMVFGVAGLDLGVKAVFWIMGTAVGCGSRIAFQHRAVLLEKT